MKTIQMLISEKKKIFFSDFLSAFFKCTLNFEPFQKKKITIIDYVFPKLRTPKRCG